MLRLDLESKLVGLIAGLLIIILAAAGILIIRQVEHAMDNENHKRGLAVANDLASFSSSALISHDLASLRYYVRYTMKQDYVHHAIILDPHGKVIMHNKLSEVGKIYSNQPSRAAINAKKSECGEHYYSEEGDRLSDIIVPIEVGGTRLGTVIIGCSHVGIEKEIAILKRQIVVMVLIAILVGMVFAVILATYISGPLKKLRDAAGEIGKGKRDITLKVKSKDEIGELVDSFNKMATDLRETTVSRDLLIDEISERKQTEEKLRAAVRTAEDEKLKSEAIIESMGDYLSIRDTDFRLLYENRILKDAFGDHVGEYCYEAFHNRDQICEGCPVAESFSDGKVHIQERVMLKGERLLCFENTASPLKDSTGKIIGGIEVARDITGRKEMEVALRQSEQKLAGIVESVTDAMIMLDEQFNVMWINDIAKDLFGPNLIGNKCYRAYHGRDEVCEPCIVKQCFEDGKVHEFETEIIGADGNQRAFWCTASVAAWYEDGHPRMVVEFLRDISERKRAEEAIEVAYDQSIIYAEQLNEEIKERKQTEEEKDKLEAQLRQAQKMEAIGTLAGGISHDFNNILQAISGYVQLLSMKKEANDADLGYLNQIGKSIQRADELTKQLLIFSRKLESKLRPVDLNQEIRQVHEILQRTLPKMIDVELHLAEGPKIINGDPIRLEQIMMNIGVNARDAMPDGGKLVFEMEDTVLDEQYCKTHFGARPGGYVLLTISDTGHGMDKETIQHIFEPFYTTKEIGKGSGLGLAMVYGIVKSHGGYITCYSEPGQGTVFKIYFPVLEASEVGQEVELEKEVEIRGGHETILFVDDEKTLCDQGRAILAEYGYTTITAESGERAIEVYKAEKDRIDLVILDVGMPGMGGLKCLEELLKIDPEIKIIIVSGYTTDDKEKETLEAGAAGFVDKPYRFTVMLKKVRELLDQ